MSQRLSVFRIPLIASFESYAIVAAPSEDAAITALLKQRPLLKVLFDNYAHPEITAGDVEPLGEDEVDLDRPAIDLVVR